MTYNCKNVVAPQCEELPQIVEVFLTNKVKKWMAEKEGERMNEASVTRARRSLLPVNQALGCLQNKLNIPMEPTLQHGRKRSRQSEHLLYTALVKKTSALIRF